MTPIADPENDVVIGITLLALAPLAGFVVALPGTGGSVRLLILIVSAEVLFAILRLLVAKGQ